GGQGLEARVAQRQAHELAAAPAERGRGHGRHQRVGGVVEQDHDVEAALGQAQGPRARQVDARVDGRGARRHGGQARAHHAEGGVDLDARVGAQQPPGGKVLRQGRGHLHGGARRAHPRYTRRH
ncbi:hypothetical protein EG872_16410, partial [Enterococcus faecalis]